MNITLKLFATFREYLPEGNNGHACNLEVPDASPVDAIMNQIQLPKDIPKIILINGIQKTASELLKDGDTLSIFPPIAGG
jgi:sulfur carrier protein